MSAAHAGPQNEQERLVIGASDAEIMHMARSAPPPEWTDPISLDEGTLPLWPDGTLPAPLGEYVEAVATGLQVPTALPGMLALAVVAITCQRRVRIELRAGWQEPLCIYAATILPPAERKSAAVAEVSEPLAAWEREEARRLAPLIAEAQAEHAILEQGLDAAIRAAAGRSATDDDRTAAQDLAREAAEHVVPRAPRLLADDATPETLATLMAEHDGRMGIISPEPTAWELAAGRYSQGRANLGIYLLAHAGDDLRIDRRGRTEYVHRPALTMAICAQPEALDGLLLTREHRGRGVMARYLYSIPASVVGERDTDAPPVPASVRARYHEIVWRLLGLPYSADEVHLLRLSADAQAGWRSYCAAVEHRLSPRRDGDLRDIPDWGGKLCGAVARIAGLLHMVEHATATRPWDAPVSRTTVDHAIDIGEYLARHALAVYGRMGADESLGRARYVLEIVRAIGAPRITRRDIHTRAKGRMHRATELDEPLAILEERGYLRPATTTRRDSRAWDVHPSITTVPTVPTVLSPLGHLSSTLPLSPKVSEQSEQSEHSALEEWL